MEGQYCCYVLRQGRYFLIWFIQIMSATEGAIRIVNSHCIAKCSSTCFALWFILFVFFQWMRSSLQTGCQAALQNFKKHRVLLLEIQLLLGCYVEWLVPLLQDSADPPVLFTACDDAVANESAQEGGSSGGVASPTRIRAGGRAAMATPPQAAGTLTRGSTGGGACQDSGGGATSPRCCRPCSRPSSRCSCRPCRTRREGLNNMGPWYLGTTVLGRDPLSQRPKREHLFGQASIICFNACWTVPDSLLLCVPVPLPQMNLSRKNISWTRTLFIW